MAMRVGLLNHIGGGNLGDEATFAAMIENIRARWPHAAICAFTMNPADTERRHSIPAHPLRLQTWSIRSTAVESKSLKSALRNALNGKTKPLSWLLRSTYAIVVRLPVTVIKELRLLTASRKVVGNLDLLVIAGGGQLTERDGTWAFPFTLFKWVLLARSCGLRCLFVNVGAGPLSRPLAKAFVRRALAAADNVSFRDSQSQALAHDIGFSGPSRVFPDGVYALALPGSLATPAIPRDRPLVGFAPVPFGDPRFHPAKKDAGVYGQFLAKCRAIVTFLIQQGNCVRLFGTDVGVDGAVNADILSGLRNQGAIDSPECCEPETVAALLKTISEMDYVITCRFHGVVFAHLLNKPVLAIAHHPKVTDLMQALGLSSYCVNIGTFDAIDILHRFVLLVRNREAVKAAMAEKLTEYWMKSAAQFDDLFPSPGPLAWPSAPWTKLNPETVLAASRSRQSCS